MLRNTGFRACSLFLAWDYFAWASSVDILLSCLATLSSTAGVQVGNPGLTVNEQRSHFALWSLFKSPLFIGADLRSLSRDAKQILTAPEVIAVNQDPLGVPGDLVWKQGPLEVSR